MDNDKQLTTSQFNKLLRMAVDKYGLDPKNTYVEITWWDNVFRPLNHIDCNWTESSNILVFGDDTCNSYRRLTTNTVFPVGFWIWKEAIDPESVIHRPLVVDNILDSKFMAQFGNVKFLFSNSPVNYYVDINPFKTRVYRNCVNETILCFYVEDRDSGEWQPFESLKADHIKMFDYERCL
jgi:hypothetical protein